MRPLQSRQRQRAADSELKLNHLQLSSPVKLKAHQLAGELAEGPVVVAAVVVDEQRKRHHVQEVGDGQVEHVNVVLGDVGPRPPDLQDDGGVEGQRQHEDQRVDGRQQDALEVLLVGAGRVSQPLAADVAAVLCQRLPGGQEVQGGRGEEEGLSGEGADWM